MGQRSSILCGGRLSHLLKNGEASVLKISWCLTKLCWANGFGDLGCRYKLFLGEVIVNKYQVMEGRWSTRNVIMPFGCRLWRNIMKEWNVLMQKSHTKYMNQ